MAEQVLLLVESDEVLVLALALLAQKSHLLSLVFVLMLVWSLQRHKLSYLKVLGKSFAVKLHRTTHGPSWFNLLLQLTSVSLSPQMSLLKQDGCLDPSDRQ